MKHRVLIPLLTIAALAHAEPKSATPAEAARAFYNEVLTRKLTGLPKGADWTALEPRVTPELATAIRGAQAEQAEFIKQNPDEKPPWIEGDLFSSLFEGAQKFTVGEAKITGDKAEVPMHFTYTDRSETSKWSDTLLLVKTAKRWLIDDLRYEASWAFANKGTLKQSFAPETN